MTTTHMDETHGVDVRMGDASSLRYEGHWKFSWAAVFAGTLVGIGTWILLHLLGMGIGLTAINPDDVHSLRGIGMTTGIWSLIAPSVAMFVGGLAAARVAGPMPPLGAVIHGAVLWSLATVASTVLLVSLVSSVMGGATRLAGDAARASAQTQNMAPGATEQPEARAERQLNEANAPRGNASKWLGNDARGNALQAAETTGKGLLGLFLAMLLGLAAALGGSVWGDARERRLFARAT